MTSRMEKVQHTGLAKQWLLIRIGLRLLVARVALAWPGLSHFTAGLARHDIPPRLATLSDNQWAQALELSELVAVAARHTPGHNSSLAQVLVLHQLLVQRQIPGCFCIGVHRPANADAQAIRSHAWLQCGTTIINGDTPGRTYSTMSAFSWGSAA